MYIYETTNRWLASVAGGIVGVCLLGSAEAQTITVDPAGTADGTTIFTNLNEAVASFAAGGVNDGNPAANVINVRSDNGAVVGKVVAIANDVANSPAPMTHTEDLLIQGVDADGDPALAVFAGLPVSDAEQNIRNGTFSAFVWRQFVNLTIQNIAFIPAANPDGNPISSFMLIKAPHSAAADPNVNIENCVFTANDGNNAPVTTTGRPEDDSKLDAAGVIGLFRTAGGGAAGIWGFSREERGDLNINLTNTVFASMSTLTGTNPRTEVFKGWMSGAPLHMINFFFNVNEGCVFANIDGNVAQIGWGGMIRMKGTDANPIVVRNFKNTFPPALIWLYYSGTSDQPVAGEFDHVHFHDVHLPAITEGGVLGTRDRAFINHVNNSVFADSPRDPLTLGSKTNLDTATGLVMPEITIDGTVFHNTGHGANPSAIYSTSGLERPVNITNSYFTDSDADMIGLTNSSTVSTWNVTDTVLSLTAPTALSAQTMGAGTITLGSGVSDAAVFYMNTTDPFSPNFYKPGSAVSDWSVY